MWFICSLGICLSISSGGSLAADLGRPRGRHAGGAPAVQGGDSKHESGRERHPAGGSEGWFGGKPTWRRSHERFPRRS